MKYFTVKEAAERTGKSTSAIRRLILPIAHDPKHKERGLILPTPAEVQALKKSSTDFGWTIAEELLDQVGANATGTAAAANDAAKNKAAVPFWRRLFKS